MRNKKIWSGVLPLTILVAIIGGLFLLGRIGARQNAVVEENGIETIGTTIDEGGKRMIRVSYEANGQIFTNGTGKPFSYIQPNEQFDMKYLEDYPESMVVFFDKPHISDEHDYSETPCTSISKTLSVVNFTYQVNGRTINRETLYRNQQLTVSNYKVVYRTNKPEIGYLVTK